MIYQISINSRPTWPNTHCICGQESIVIKVPMALFSNIIEGVFFRNKKKKNVLYTTTRWPIEIPMTWARRYRVGQFADSLPGRKEEAPSRLFQKLVTPVRFTSGCFLTQKNSSYTHAHTHTNNIGPALPPPMSSTLGPHLNIYILAA